MTNQGEDLLDDLQEFLEHFGYDSDDDLTSYYDSEGSFYDSEDYDWLESLSDEQKLRDVLDLLLDQSDKKKKKKKKNKSAKQKARKEKRKKRKDARKKKKDMNKGKKEFQKTGHVDDDSSLGQWLEDLGTVSTVDRPAPASNFTKLPNSIVEEIGEIALYVTHYVAFDNILKKFYKAMGWKYKLGDAAQERRTTAFEKCDDKCIELSKGLLSAGSIVAMKKIFIAKAENSRNSDRAARKSYKRLVKNGECSRELIKKIEELGEAAYEYQKCKVENPEKEDDIKSFERDFNLAKEACGCIPVMEEMRLFNANGDPTTWGSLEPKSVRPIVACTKTLVNECPDTEQEMTFDFTLSETKTISCTKGVEWNFNVTVGLEAGLEFIVDASASVEVSTGVTKSKEFSQEVSKSNEQTFSFPLKCPGGKTVQGIASVMEQDMEVVFHQVFKINEVEWVKHGIWRGKKNASLSYTVKDL